MAAAAAVQLSGGTPAQAGHAASLALQGQMGLVCDPIGGLVEVPCVYRNATGAAVALAAAEMALAGVEFPVPFDEVVDAMGLVGRSLPPSLRETALGGLAITPTGRDMSVAPDRYRVRGLANPRCALSKQRRSRPSRYAADVSARGYAYHCREGVALRSRRGRRGRPTDPGDMPRFCP